ncbi:MAG: hypothetical protein GEU79_13560 [Acidimicrobiia bacterium]|nr:hypothetical protein [Acidimicrobiia bacterium]
MEGLSDWDAIAALRTDLRWKVAAGLALDDEGFHPTVWTLWRNKLRACDHLERIFDAVRSVIAEAGVLTGEARRALDSTLLDDAVATRRRRARRRYLYAIPALVGPASGTTSTSLKPTSLHHEAKSAPVKSNASPNSIITLSDMRRPNAFSRRASSMMFSMTM